VTASGGIGELKAPSVLPATKRCLTKRIPIFSALLFLGFAPPRANALLFGGHFDRLSRKFRERKSQASRIGSAG
jgi:hypothetical protein